MGVGIHMHRVTSLGRLNVMMQWEHATNGRCILPFAKPYINSPCRLLTGR
jgi:hypothetical protein